ncbi:MAG: metal-sensitive transcriptional regulator [Pelotomaculaceae bacterium]|jgi:DNA-binding FrmR family transcriptional regulator|nr:metal-sensitive transcriptional regulator [Bacillota bacterium]HHU86462.1 metal-sensing transcriptional repressor [Peptococcaceae bacterium]
MGGEHTGRNNCPNCHNGDKYKRRSWQEEKIVRELVIRLNRIEGQVRGIKRMIEEGVYCDSVLNQIASVQSALNGAARLLLEKHMKTCIKEQLIAGDDEVINELTKTVFRLINK